MSVTATPASLVFGDSGTLATSGGSGDGVVSYALTSGASSCSLEDDVLTGTGVGSCTVTATRSGGTNHLDASATVTVAVTPRADLQVAKDANRLVAQVGDTVVYSIVVANAGPNDAVGVILSDTPPVTLVDVEWACIAAGSSVPCPGAPHDAGTGPLDVVFDLPTDGYLRYDLSATVQGVLGAQVANTAVLTVPAGVTDDEPGNNQSTATLLVVPEGIFGDGFESGGMDLTVPAAQKARTRP